MQTHTRRTTKIVEGAEAPDDSIRWGENGDRGALHHWRHGLIGALQYWAQGSEDFLVKLIIDLIGHFDVVDKVKKDKCALQSSIAPL